jgi:CRP-like cAMP-binding protein
LVVAFDVPDPNVYLIWQGTARMFNPEDPRALVDIGPGGIVGDMIASSRLRVPHSVVATTDCEVLVIEAHAAGVLAADYPDVVSSWRQLVAIRSSRLSPSHDDADIGWVPEASTDAIAEVKDS